MECARVSIAPFGGEFNIAVGVWCKGGCVWWQREGRWGFDVELEFASLESKPVVVGGGVGVQEGGLALSKDFCTRLKDCCEHVLDCLVEFDIRSGSMFP